MGFELGFLIYPVSWASHFTSALHLCSLPPLLSRAVIKSLRLRVVEIKMTPVQEPDIGQPRDRQNSWARMQSQIPEQKKDVRGKRGGTLDQFCASANFCVLTSVSWLLRMLTPGETR